MRAQQAQRLVMALADDPEYLGVDDASGFLAERSRAAQAAGAFLLEHSALSPVVMELTPFVKGLTLSCWAIGSLWIPLLVVLGVWRYLIHSVPFTYDPLYWGGVFPLGIYSVCTYRLTKVLAVPFLMPLSEAFMVIAVAAWAAAFVGLVDSRLSPTARAQSSPSNAQ